MEEKIEFDEENVRGTDCLVIGFPDRRFRKKFFPLNGDSFGCYQKNRCTTKANGYYFPGGDDLALLIEGVLTQDTPIWKRFRTSLENRYLQTPWVAGIVPSRDIKYFEDIRDLKGEFVNVIQKEISYPQGLLLKTDYEDDPETNQINWVDLPNPRHWNLTGSLVETANYGLNGGGTKAFIPCTNYHPDIVPFDEIDRDGLVRMVLTRHGSGVERLRKLLESKDLKVRNGNFNSADSAGMLGIKLNQNGIHISGDYLAKESIGYLMGFVPPGDLRR